MNDSELKQLYNSIKPTQNETEQMIKTVDSISNLLKNNISGNVKIAELHVGGSFAKGTIIKVRKEVDMVVAISPKSKNKFYYQDLANLSMNYIENAFYLNYYDRLKNQTEDSKLVRNYDRNTLSMKDTNDVDVDFLIKFKKEQLIATTKKNVENFYLERDTQQLKFVNVAAQEYSKFKNCVMLLKYFRNQENAHALKSYMIEIILYYSLDKYLKDDKTYVDYMNSFFKGLNDFIGHKRIEVSQKMYNTLGTSNNKYPNDDYMIIDVANKSNNVAEYINSSNIKSIKNFFTKYNGTFINEKAQSTSASVKIGLFYCDDTHSTFEWRLISDEETKKGGNYSVKNTSRDDEVQVLLKALAKAINYADSKKIKNLYVKMAERDYDIIENKKIDGHFIGDEKSNNISSLLGVARKKEISIKFQLKD